MWANRNQKSRKIEFFSFVAEFFRLSNAQCFLRFRIENSEICFSLRFIFCWKNINHSSSTHCIWGFEFSTKKINKINISCVSSLFSRNYFFVLSFFVGRLRAWFYRSARTLFVCRSEHNAKHCNRIKTHWKNAVATREKETKKNSEKESLVRNARVTNWNRRNVLESSIMWATPVKFYCCWCFSFNFFSLHSLEIVVVQCDSDFIFSWLFIVKSTLKFSLNPNHHRLIEFQWNNPFHVAGDCVFAFCECVAAIKTCDKICRMGEQFVDSIAAKNKCFNNSNDNSHVFLYSQNLPWTDNKSKKTKKICERQREAKMN